MDIHKQYQTIFNRIYSQALGIKVVFSLGCIIAGLLFLVWFILSCFQSSVSSARCIYLFVACFVFLLFALLSFFTGKRLNGPYIFLAIWLGALFIFLCLVTIILSLSDLAYLGISTVIVIGSFFTSAYAVVGSSVFMSSQFTGLDINKVKDVIRSDMVSVSGKERRNKLSAFQSIAAIQIGHKQMLGAFFSVLLGVCLAVVQSSEATRDKSLWSLTTYVIGFILLLITLSAFTDSLMARAFIVLLDETPPD